VFVDTSVANPLPSEEGAIQNVELGLSPSPPHVRPGVVQGVEVGGVGGWGLVFKAHRLCVSLNSRLESNKEEEEEEGSGFRVGGNLGSP